MQARVQACAHDASSYSTNKVTTVYSSSFANFAGYTQYMHSSPFVSPWNFDIIIEAMHVTCDIIHAHFL